MSSREGGKGGGDSLPHSVRLKMIWRLTRLMLFSPSPVRTESWLITKNIGDAIIKDKIRMKMVMMVLVMMVMMVINTLISEGISGGPFSQKHPEHSF